MRVEVEIATDFMENDNGHEVEGICATCTRCGHETQSFGTSERSVKRCLALLREECPNSEENFYVDADANEDD